MEPHKNPLKLADINQIIAIIIVAAAFYRGILPLSVRLVIAISGLSYITFLQFYYWYRGTLRFTYVHGLVLVLALLNVLLRPSGSSVIVIVLVGLFSALAYFSGRKHRNREKA